MFTRSLFFSLLTSVLSFQAFAQECDPKVTPTAPSTRFKVTGEGVVVDKQHKRTWLACALGMRWNGSTCEGQTHTYSWNEAVEEIEALNKKKVGGRSDWRLPTVDELGSIVEKSCFKPAINLEVFPYSPESGFWTDSEVEGVQPRVRLIHFLHGEAYIANKRQTWRVRPVAGPR